MVDPHSHEVVDPLDGKLHYIPTEWPPSEDMRWINNQIELTARNIQTQEDADKWFKKSALDLKTLIERESVPKNLVRMTVDVSIEHRFSGKWQWTEFKEKGYFYGSKLKDIEAARAPFSNWNELIGIVANTVAASKAILKA